MTVREEAGLSGFFFIFMAQYKSAHAHQCYTTQFALARSGCQIPDHTAYYFNYSHCIRKNKNPAFTRDDHRRSCDWPVWVQFTGA